MIVTCPNCEAKYRVSEAALAERRGKVRCASCGHAWTVADDEALTLSAPVASPEPAPEPEPEPQPSFQDKPHAAIRARQEDKRRRARLAAEGAGWAAVAACALVLLGGAWLFRVDIVEAFPRAAGAYAAVGAPVNPYGFEVRDLSVAPGAQTDAVLVQGVLANVSDRERGAPALQATLYAADGSALGEQVFEIDAARVPAGETAAFTALLPAPETAVRVEVRLAVEAR